MSHIYRKRANTKQQIIRLASKLFIEEGYENTSLTKIAKLLDISTGNITFYFSTKEHLLAVLVDELFRFQAMLMEHYVQEGKSSLLAYCLELTSIAAACEEDLVARDFYCAVYSSALTLDMIRQNDTEKTKNVFSAFRPDWTEQQWISTEDIVSGIEYATIRPDGHNTPLEVRIENALNTILWLYGVPKELRQAKIQKVLSMDYRSLGTGILSTFREYIDNATEETTC